jgi:PAS domain S-box-containing protein
MNIPKKLNLDEMHAAIIEQAPDGIIIMDMKMNIVEANPQACRQFGYSREELLGKHLSAIERSVDLHSIEAMVDRLEMVGTALFESYATRKDGSQLPVALKACMMELEGRAFIVAFSRDISAQKKIEKKLEGERNFMNALMDNFPDSIYFKDRDSRLIRVNRKLVQDLGAKSESEILGKTDVELFGETFGRHTRAIEQKIMQTGDPCIGLVESREQEDGSLYWTLTTKVPLRNERGEIVGIAGVSREINEIKRAEETMRIRENQLSVASQIAGLAYWEFNVEEQLFTFNDHFYDIFHTSFEEVGSYHMSPREYAERFLFPEDRDLIRVEIEKAIYTIDPNFNSKIDHRIRYPDGTTGYVTVRYFTVKDRYGRTVKTFGASQNITERLLAEKAIRDNEAQLSVATQIAKLGYWEYNAKTDLITFSEQFYKLLGFAPEDLGGYTMSPEEYGRQLLTPEDFEKVVSEISGALQNPNPVNQYFEHRIRYANGVLGYSAVRFITIRNDRGRIYKAIGIHQDITDRKQAEMALIESETNLQKAFEIAAIGPCKYSIEDDRYEWTDRALEVVGMEADEAPQTFEDFLKIVHPDDVQKLWDEIRRSNEVGLFDLEHRVIIKGKLKWIRFRSHVEYDEHHQPISTVGVVQDITARKQAEEELASYREKLEQLVRRRTAQLENINKDLEAFAYSISHDLRAPLRHINGFSNMLKRRLAADISAETVKYINLITEASSRMGTMIDGLLHFSRLGRQKIQHSDINMNKLIEEIIAEFQPDLTHRKLEWKISALPVISGDLTLLKVAFENLISNAVKYTSREEHATIEIGVCEYSEPCTIYIKDNGVGFDMTYADQLFGVFQRLHRDEEFPGTGIGLANVQQIIKKHGGSIYAHSEEGKGTTFYIRFKLSDGEKINDPMLGF